MSNRVYLHKRVFLAGPAPHFWNQGNRGPGWVPWNSLNVHFFRVLASFRQSPAGGGRRESFDPFILSKKLGWIGLCLHATAQISNKNELRFANRQKHKMQIIKKNMKMIAKKALKLVFWKFGICIIHYKTSSFHYNNNKKWISTSKNNAQSWKTTILMHVLTFFWLAIWRPEIYENTVNIMLFRFPKYAKLISEAKSTNAYCSSHRHLFCFY